MFFLFMSFDSLCLSLICGRAGFIGEAGADFCGDEMGDEDDREGAEEYGGEGVGRKKVMEKFPLIL